MRLSTLIFAALLHMGKEAVEHGDSAEVDPNL
jgi:hypothetical protein